MVGSGVSQDYSFAEASPAAADPRSRSPVQPPHASLTILFAALDVATATCACADHVASARLFPSRAKEKRWGCGCGGGIGREPRWNSRHFTVYL